PTLTVTGAITVNKAATYVLNLASSDPGSDTITNWTINWGDGTAPQVVTGNPSSVAHAFSASGNYTISATATDEDGIFASNTVAVNVTNIATPVVTIKGNAVVNEGALYTLTLTGKSAVGHPISQWAINWGDGTIQTVTGNPAAVTHVY